MSVMRPSRPRASVVPEVGMTDGRMFRCRMCCQLVPVEQGCSGDAVDGEDVSDCCDGCVAWMRRGQWMVGEWP